MWSAIDTVDRNEQLAGKDRCLVTQEVKRLSFPQCAKRMQRGAVYLLADRSLQQQQQVPSKAVC